VLADLGVIGGLLFSLTWITALRRTARAGSHERRFAVILALVLIAGLQVRHWEYERPLWTLLAIVVGLSLAERPAAE
jgi:hypothetical protein